MKNYRISERGDSSMGMMFGVILIMIMLFLFFVFGLPMMRQSSAPSIEVPGKVDVNLNQGTK